MNDKKNPDGPCDTRMMSIVHAALRRDLTRAETLLQEPAATSRLPLLGEHLEFLAEWLHVHHTTEDDHLYPQVRAKAPEVGELLDLMDSEHAAIGPALAALEEAGRRAAAGDPTIGVPELRAAVVALRTALEPHLEHEERQMMPVVEQTLTRAEWDAYDAHNIEKPKAQLAFEGHWVLDGLSDGDDYRTVTSLVPPVVRFVLLHLMGGPYRRRRDALWGGTSAARIGSTPLPRLAAGPVA